MRMAKILLILFALPAVAPADSLPEKIDAIRQQAGVAATAVVLVDKQGLVAHHVFGWNDWETRRPVTREQTFRVGSISKLLTGIAALKAEANGHLDLNSPVRQWAPKTLLANRWADESPLRLAHLLEHTAGWYDMSGFEFDHSDPKPLSLLAALSLRPQSRVSQWRPGRHSEYSNSGAGMAAFVLEKATGEDFEVFVQREVFQPLSMTSATYRLTEKVKATLPVGYDRDGKTPIRYWHIIYRPAGGLNLNPADMAPLLQMLIHNGRIGGEAFLTPAQMRRLLHPQTTLAARHGLTFGYGLGIYQSQYRGHSLFGHGGDADGYLAHFAFSPETERGYFVVITAFNHKPLRAMRDVLADWVIAGHQRPSDPPVFTLSEAEKSRYVGQYERASVRFPRQGWRQERLDVRLHNSQLQTRKQGDRYRPLLAVDEKRFRRPWESVATSIFIVEPDGAVFLQGGMGNWRRLEREATINDRK